MYCACAARSFHRRFASGLKTRPTKLRGKEAQQRFAPHLLAFSWTETESGRQNNAAHPLYIANLEQ